RPRPTVCSEPLTSCAVLALARLCTARRLNTSVITEQDAVVPVFVLGANITLGIDLTAKQVAQLDLLASALIDLQIGSNATVFFNITDISVRRTVVQSAQCAGPCLRLRSLALS